MVDVFENVGDYTITRLRGPDAAFLAGATRPVGLPDPIAIAEGPANVVGPSGIVTTGEFWVVGSSIAAAPDLVWVLIAADILVKFDSAVSSDPTISYFYPRGNIAVPNDYLAPALGSATLSIMDFVPGAGLAANSALSPSRSGALWVPLDPVNTTAGFTSVHILSNGGSFSVNDVDLDLRGVRFLGYPANVWGTGGLWAPAASRGS